MNNTSVAVISEKRVMDMMATPQFHLFESFMWSTLALIVAVLA